MTSLLRRVFALLALVPALAQAQAPPTPGVVGAEIRPGWQTGNGRRMAALHLQLADGWITYWRHPGESGIPTRLDLSGSTNLRAATLHWPEPRLYMKAGFASIGYAGALVLPIELVPDRPDAPVGLQVRLTAGVCDDICIPLDVALSARLSGAGARDRRIAAALDRQPAAARDAGLSAVECQLTPDDDGIALSARWRMPQKAAREYMVLEVPDTGWRVRSLPSVRDGASLTGHARLRPQAGGGGALARDAIRMTMVTPDGAVTQRGCALER